MEGRKGKAERRKSKMTHDGHSHLVCVRVPICTVHSGTELFYLKSFIFQTLSILSQFCFEGQFCFIYSLPVCYILTESVISDLW